MATLEEITAEVQTEIDAEKTANGGEGKWVQSKDGRREYTSDEYDQAVVDIANYRYDDQQNGYKEARQNQYGSIGDQLDMIYWDQKNDTTTFKDHIDQVKADNPKPE